MTTMDFPQFSIVQILVLVLNLFLINKKFPFCNCPLLHSVDDKGY